MVSPPVDNMTTNTEMKKETYFPPEVFTLIKSFTKPELWTCYCCNETFNKAFQERTSWGWRGAPRGDRFRKKKIVDYCFDCQEFKCEGCGECDEAEKFKCFRCDKKFCYAECYNSCDFCYSTACDSCSGCECGFMNEYSDDEE